MSFFDGHVHFRDFEQAYKETVAHGLEVARDSGVIAVLDMPNPIPPILDEETVRMRLALAHAASVPEVFYGLYMGLTADPEQVRRAVAIYHAYEQVAGMKLYAGHSVGNLGVTEQEDQRVVYVTLAAEGYDGVLAVHAEDEGLIDHALWDPRYPISHCIARSPESEVSSVRAQIEHVRASGFSGKLHIAHISSPEAVDLVVEARRSGMDVSSGVCPHHLVYDWSQMFAENGVLWKMNPPLRPLGAPQRMLEHLRAGDIDWIETDHAPHSLEEKTQHPFMSGIPGLPWWDLFAEYLRRHEFSEARIERVTRDNAIERFGIDVPTKTAPRRNRTGDYAFDPYSALEARLGLSPRR